MRLTLALSSLIEFIQSFTDCCISATQNFKKIADWLSTSSVETAGAYGKLLPATDG